MDPFIGQIIIFAGNFTIRGYQPCAGQIMSIAQNSALFAILGTTYGGNGQTTFALPDLRSRSAVGTGNGPGLQPIELGEMAGTPNVTLTTANMPAHTHPILPQVEVSSSPANTDEPGGSFLTTTNSNFYSTTGAPGTHLGGVSGTTGITGSNQPVSNLSPYLGLNYQIAIEGIFPPHN
jgi:microcystin-dependent protein